MRYFCIGIIALFLFTSCKFRDSSEEIENTLRSLKDGKNSAEVEKLDKAVQVLRTYSYREKLNKPSFYDGTSINDILLSFMENQSLEAIVTKANQFILEKKERITYLRKEIEKARAAVANTSESEKVFMTEYAIEKAENVSITLTFKSSQEFNVQNFRYLIEIYKVSDRNILQSIGLDSNAYSEQVSFQKNQVIIRTLLNDRLRQYLKNLESSEFPIKDVTPYGLSVRSYAYLFNNPDKKSMYKPRPEDDYSSDKNLEELKRDLIRLNLLVSNLSK